MQVPWRHFESGLANTSEFFEKKNLKGPLFSKFSKSGWAMPHLAHPPTRALQEAIYVSILITEMKWLEMHFFAPCSEKMGNYG